MATKLPTHIEERNRARDFYNPLRGLDMPRLVRLLEDGERGQHADLQWLYRMIEKRDATVKSLKLRRTSALQKLSWNIKLPKRLPRGVTRAQANAQVDFLLSAYERIENLPEVFGFCALASFRGFAHLEKRHQDDNPALPVIRLEPVPQWHWVRDPFTWAWKYDPEARNNYTSAVAIDRSDFIIRELDDPINEIAVIAFLRKNMSQKDWDAFVEDFGIPSIFAILGINTPAGEVKSYLAQLEKVTGNSRGALPPGTDIKTVAHGGQGDTPFKQHKDEQREEVVLAGTGGLLSMLTAPTGLGSDQASVHDAAFDAIALAEANSISSIFQTQFDKPLLKQEFPSMPAVAYFELAAEDREDLDSLAERLVKLYSAGLESDENEISEKMGLKLRKKTASAEPAETPIDEDEAVLKNRDPGPPIDADMREELSEAQLNDLEPVYARLAALNDAEDDAAWLKIAREIHNDWETLLDQWVKAGGKAEVLNRLFGSEFVDGAVEGAKARAETKPVKALKNRGDGSTPRQRRKTRHARS